MHRRAAPSLELAHQDDSVETFGMNEDPATPTTFFRPRTGNIGSLATTSGVLCLSSLVLHSLLVATHVILLAGVLILHITTPALFSLEAFNTSRSVLVETHGAPSFNWSSSPGIDIVDNLLTFLPQPLSQLPSVFQNSIPTLGLHNGAIYDVLVVNEGVGTINVGGTGFNMTCGYLPDVILTPVENTTSWNVTWPELAPYYEIIYTTQPGLIVPINRTYVDTVLFYSTMPILDSSASSGLTHTLAPLLDNATSTIQILACSQSRINQTAVVDAQSRKVLSLDPDFQKTTSTWSPYTGLLDRFGGDKEWTLNPNATDNLFLELWGLWYTLIPSSDFPLSQAVQYEVGAPMLSLADLRLNQMLNTVAYLDRPQNVTLHALENALSTIIASMFWALGNIPPSHGFISGTTSPLDSINSPAWFSSSTGPFSWQETPVTTMSSETRLDLSIIAVVAGLVVSILLLLLSLPSSLFHRGNGAELPVGGTGLLHSIWLYRNHPELETLLEQVAHPTHNNLCAAGMVRTTLLGTARRSRESFLMTRRRKDEGVRS
ncbi:hypothetical protein B0H19DRAFT_1370797 [Mycena capillaripes]|nr:hypothetical protein B0H19DRAFT_1370797 [Mycena capillaripes]